VGENRGNASTNTNKPWGGGHEWEGRRLPVTKTPTGRKQDTGVGGGYEGLAEGKRRGEGKSA